MNTKNNNSRRNTYCTTQTRISTKKRKRKTSINQENTNKKKKVTKTLEKKMNKYGKRIELSIWIAILYTKEQTTLR